MKKIAKNFPFSLVSILLAAILFYVVIGFGVKQFANVQLLVNFSGNYLFKLMDLFLIGFITIGSLALSGSFIQNLRKQ